jgi:crossover junction endodeoxyribonuclease RuvC
MLYVGIDPGASGGIAVINPDGSLSCRAMPASDKELWGKLSMLADPPRHEGESLPQVVAVIEKVGGYMPGSAGNIGSAMFSFGRSTGFLHGCLVAAAIPYEEVAPRTWQKALGIASRAKTETKSQFKRRLKAKAEQLFPSANITLKTCDAILLATYCQRKHSGTLAR